jgi:hypothetical protein
MHTTSRHEDARQQAPLYIASDAHHDREANGASFCSKSGEGESQTLASMRAREVMCRRGTQQPLQLNCHGDLCISWGDISQLDKVSSSAISTQGAAAFLILMHDVCLSSTCQSWVWGIAYLRALTHLELASPGPSAIQELPDKRSHYVQARLQGGWLSLACRSKSESCRLERVQESRSPGGRCQNAVCVHVFAQ